MDDLTLLSDYASQCIFTAQVYKPEVDQESCYI